jgi:hypothetical protein
MKPLERMERRFGRFAIPNVTLLLIAGQVVLYVMSQMPVVNGQALSLDVVQLAPELVLQGEIWRLVTYLFQPPATNPIFAFFFWYLFYLMGTALENIWGAFRYNVFLGIGFLASIAAAFVYWFVFRVPGGTASNAYLQGTVFLAFARFYPDFTLLMFFVLPVKIRWLALLTWLYYGLTLVTANDWMTRLMVVAAVLNYLVFFGRDIWQDVRHGQRRMQFRARTLRKDGQMVHTCRVCGLSSKVAPQTPFRYCSQCGGEYCYCPDHLSNHEHVAGQVPVDQSGAA